MNHPSASQAACHPNDAAWFGDDSLPHAREDRVADAVALVALVFSLCIGIVIALLPG
jgi:hypothetical protein